MSTRENAFPVAINTGAEVIVQPGMTLRDYFAGQALSGWLATFSRIDDAADVHTVGVAKFAYEMADAMLTARSG